MRSVKPFKKGLISLMYRKRVYQPHRCPQELSYREIFRFWRLILIGSEASQLREGSKKFQLVTKERKEVAVNFQYSSAFAGNLLRELLTLFFLVSR